MKLDVYLRCILTILFIIGYILWENFKHLAIWNKTGKNPLPKLANQVERNIWPSITYLLVIATMRNITKKENLEAAIGSAFNQTLEIKQLDVCDEKSIHNCINSIPQRHIDILSEYSELQLYQPSRRRKTNPMNPCVCVIVCVSVWVWLS